MKTILIRLTGVVCGKSRIIVLSENKKVLFEKYFTNNLFLSLKENEGYYFLINNYNIFIKEKIYIDSHTKCFNFNFYNLINIPRKIIFQLKDINYPNLPIEKGEMIVWQKQ